MNDEKSFEDFLLHMIQDDFGESIENPNSVINNRGTTLLHSAVERNDYNHTKSLIDAGCKIDVRDNDGNTPLILASKIDKISIAQLLLRANASVLITNKRGKCAAEIVIRDLRLMDRIIMPLLLEKVKKECLNDSLSTAKKLLEFNCSLTQVVNLKDTSVTKFMLENGFDVNERHAGFGPGFTALHWAVATSDVENVKLLLSYGADINARNNRDRRRPVDCLNCEKDESAEILKLLMEKGESLWDANGDFLHGEFLRRGNKKMIKILMQLYELDLNDKDPGGVPLLYYLAGNYQFDPIEELRGQQLDADTVRYTHGESSALLAAINQLNVRTVEFLLINGAPVDNDKTALFFAINPCKFGYQEGIYLNLKCVELLLQYGADAQWKDNDEKTIFDLVLRTKNFTLVKPILADLALKQFLGSKIEDFVLAKINSHIFFRNYFDFCKRKVEDMKEKVVSYSVTLFKFFTVDEERIVNFARYKNLVSRLKLMAHSTRRSNLYYHKVLRKRIAKLVEIGQLRKKALNVLPQIEGLESNHIIVAKIVDFFNYEDLQIIAQV